MWSTHEPLVLIISIFFITSNYAKTTNSKSEKPIALPVADILANRIKDAQYPAEIHTVQTEDGYILQMLRIPYGRKLTNDRKPRKPVFIMHPFLESANAWIVQGPEKALAFLLAEAGYDVWLGNARGTEMSRQHAWLDPNEKKFWEYSWQDIGQKDLPAFIDHVLKETKFAKLTYVGFSQGTTVFLAMLATRPEYNKKIHQANLIAPVAFLQHTESKFYKTMSTYYSQLKMLFRTMGLHKITVENIDILKKAEYFCKGVTAQDSKACNFFTWFIGFERIDPVIVPAILQHVPAGVSLKQIMHFAQLMRSGAFQQFDYDDKMLNWLHYGQTTPPKFDLTRITVDINMYLSKNDTTTTYIDVMELRSQLPTVKDMYVIDGFKHSDFIYNTQAADLVYKKVISNIGRAGKMIGRIFTA